MDSGDYKALMYRIEDVDKRVKRLEQEVERLNLSIAQLLLLGIAGAVVYYYRNELQPYYPMALHIAFGFAVLIYVIKIVRWIKGYFKRPANQ
jgi:hypothetical protein